MKALGYIIVLSAGLMLTGCTVHHYHHGAKAGKGCKAHGDKAGHGAKAGCAGQGGGEGCKGHGDKAGHGAKAGCAGHGGGQGCKGHGGKAGHGKGHGGGHGMKGHGGGHGKGHGGGHGMKGHGGGHGMKGHGGGHNSQQMANVPAPMRAYHDALMPAMHMHDQVARRAAVCKAVPSLKESIVALKAHKAQGDASAWTAAVTKLGTKTDAVGAACSANSELHTVMAGVKEAMHGLHDVVSK